MIASLAESGGAEMLVRNLSLAYAARGHQCHVVYISDAAALGASAAYERGFVAALDGAGIGHTMLGHDSRRNPLLGAWRLRRAVRAFRPDVLHLHLAWGLLFQALGLLRARTVYTHHNIVFKFPPRLFRIFDRFVTRYVAICEACRTVLAQHVGRPIVLIYNGVPRSFAQPAVDRVDRQVIEVLSVGNLTPQKYYPRLVAAASLLVRALAARGCAIRFRIAGEGPERGAIERLVAEAGLVDHIELLGARRDVAALMAQADVLVLASRFEGLPLTLIEAAMAGLPVVATDVGGNAEIVADGVTGSLVPPSDPAAIARAIQAITDDAALRTRMGEAACARANRFALDRCVDAHLALYAEVAAR